ncbi:MAG: PKD domain-containing protein [Bacteroidetes bacterium]|nr:PKD domain-containing protein [Bacteroidota bacterium]
MPNFTRVFLLLTLFVQPIIGSAQMVDFCGTDAKVQEALKRYPHLQKSYTASAMEQEKRDIQNFANGYSSAKTSNAIYIIPVVFHIIHENGPENVSDAQVKDAIRVLNNDFRKWNSDTNLIVPAFQALAADCQILFKLAQIDPNGNCTNGIDRIYSSQTNIGDDGSKLNPWPYQNYYNIWVVKNISPGGIAGYAYYPGTAPPNAEGVIILHNYLGSIGTSSPFSSRVLTHETGHYLDLPHVWGSTNSPGVACGDDGVSDTPITKGWTSCNLNGTLCTSAVLENVQNYMEYSYCTKMFTWGQKSRMVSALNSFDGSRNTLWTNGNLLQTGVDNPVLCSADFTAFPNAGSLCEGESITFKDVSYNGIPTSWSWSFPGGTLVPPSTANDSMPTVQYPSAGTYSVSLSVSNGSSTASTTKSSFVTVNAATAQFVGNSFIEDFETHLVPGDWIVKDLDASGITWQKTSSAQTSGNFSIFLNNNLANLGDADELISPSINIAAIASPYFTFKYAFASRSGSASKLLVFVSPDCGKSWFQRKGISGTALPTAPSTFGTFVPQANEWKQEVVSIANVFSQPNVLIKFKYINEDGNNLFIDDINIISVLGINPNSASTFDFSIGPNPITAQTKMSIVLEKKSMISVDVLTLTGQNIIHMPTEEFGAGMHQIEIGKQTNLPAGVYFVQVLVNGQQFTKKLLVN